MKITKTLFPVVLIGLVALATGCGKDAKLPNFWPEPNPTGHTFSMKIPEFKAPTFKKKTGPGFWETWIDPRTKAINESLSKWGPKWGESS